MSQAGLSNTKGIPSIATQYDEDIGTAIPSGGILKVRGGVGIITSGSGNIITITNTATAPALTITGQSGGALSPVLDNWNIIGTSTSAGSAPVVTSGSGNTLTINVQTAQAIVATDATKIGLASFDSAAFSIDANGFVTLLPSTIYVPYTGAISDVNLGTHAIIANSATLTNALTVPNGGTGAKTLTGILTGNGTSAITANAVTQYGTVIAGASNAVSSVAPSATSGVPYISQGAAFNPAFGTAVVAGGGTGNTTFTAYSVICAGTTATGIFQNVSGVGSSGQVLTSNGAAMLPTWQAGGGAATKTVTVTQYTASNTWTKAAGTINMIVVVYNAGSGGGSGRQGATTAAGGGGGGAAGAYCYYSGSAAFFNTSETVTVGSGTGTGAMGQASGATNGVNGGVGGISAFGSIESTVGTNSNGKGGTTTNSGAVTNSITETWNNTTLAVINGSLTILASATGTNTAGNGSSLGSATNYVGGCGGAGGGGGDTGTARSGGVGGANGDLTGNTILIAGGTAGIETGTVAGGNGNPGTYITGGFNLGGTGGGGGGGMKSIGPGHGGTGGAPGGGGGGGGGSITGTTSGAGGNGGTGWVIVYEYNY